MAPIYQSYFRGYQLHQQLTFYWIPLPYKWNADKMSWEYKPKWYLAVYLFFTGGFGLGGVIFCSTSLSFCFIRPGLCTNLQKLGLGLEVMMCIIAFVFVLVALAFGCDITRALDWCHSKVGKLNNFGNPKFQRVVAAFVIGSEITLWVLGFAFAIAAVYKKVDPFEVTLDYTQWFSEYRHIWKIFQYIFVAFAAEVLITCFRTFCTTTLVALTLRVEVVRSLKDQFPTRELTFVYRESLIFWNLFKPYEQLSSFLFIYVFLLVIANIHIIIIAIEMGNIMLICVSSVVLIGASIIGQFTLIFCSSLYDLAGDTLFQWNKKLGDIKNNVRFLTYKKREIKALRRMAVPLGAVGIVDREMKINYTENTLGYTTDSILAKSSI